MNMGIDLNEINCVWSIKSLTMLNINQQKLIFNKINQYLGSLKVEDRILWAMKYLPNQYPILSSSFGIHSVVSLHLINYYYPNIPVVLIDTGYLFPETYRFIDLLVEKMKLNLHIFRSERSSAWQEARYGKLWEKGIEGLKKYNFINKVEPMRRALKKLRVDIWFAGLRRDQSYSRKNLQIIDINNDVFKFLPIVDWNAQEMNQYIQQYHLEYHPLSEKGYVSVGDIHTTIKKSFGMKDEDTRFFGLQRECGLHTFD